MFPFHCNQDDFEFGYVLLENHFIQGHFDDSLQFVGDILDTNFLSVPHQCQKLSLRLYVLSTAN